MPLEKQGGRVGRSDADENECKSPRKLPSN